MGLFGKSDKEKEQEDIARANEARVKLEQARRHQAEEAAKAAPAPGARPATPTAGPGPGMQPGPGPVAVSQPISADEVYVVAHGDSLSKIAKHHLGHANDWRKIYEANRDVIGDDPDLIKPGQRLRIPKASGGGSKSA
jgi:nucleoid-associated protein YgaU